MNGLGWSDLKHMDEIERDHEKLMDGIKFFFALVVLSVVVGVTVYFTIEAIVKTVENEEKYPVYRVQYSKPAAFRKATPTMEQMESLEALRKIDRGM